MKSVYLDKKGNVLETSMDDIEISIVKQYYNRNMTLMEK